VLPWPPSTQIDGGFFLSDVALGKIANAMYAKDMQ
jgi:hypothetical protein